MMQIKAATEEQYPFLEQLYIEAFPEEERRPFPFLLTCTKQNKSQMLYLYDEEIHCPIGLAFTLEYDDMVLLDYFAISLQYRNLGYGSQALSQLKKFFSQKHFFLEIELADEAATNNEQRIHRRNFYLRNGMHESQLHVDLFTVPMEILFSNPANEITFERYHKLYEQTIGTELAKNVRIIQ